MEPTIKQIKIAALLTIALGVAGFVVILALAISTIRTTTEPIPCYQPSTTPTHSQTMQSSDSATKQLQPAETATDYQLTTTTASFQPAAVTLQGSN